MGSFFRIYGPLYQVMSRCWQILVLNAVVLLASLPIVTIGIAQTAAFSVAIKMAAGKDVAVWGEFWMAFRKNVKQPTLVWGVTFIVTYLLIVIWRYSVVYRQFDYWMIGVAVVTMLALHVEQTVYFYLARFEGGLKEAVVNCIKLAVISPFQSVGLLLLFVGPLILMSLSATGFLFVLYSCLFYGLGVLIYLRAKWMTVLFGQFQCEEV